VIEIEFHSSRNRFGSDVGGCCISSGRDWKEEREGQTQSESFNEMKVSRERERDELTKLLLINVPGRRA